MKKALGLMLALMMIFVVACGNSNGDSNNGAVNTPSTPAVDTPDKVVEPVKVEQLKLKLGTIRPDEDPTTISAKKFAELVSEKSGGNIKITVHSNSSIGGIVDIFTGMQSGTVDMMYEGISSYGWLEQAKDFNIMSFPFYWESYEQMIKVLETDEFMQMFEDTAKATGVRVFKAIGDTEPRQLSANKAINNADDFKGLKIRTAEAKIVQETVKALGAEPVVIPFADLYIALRQGTADAQENGFITQQTASLFEVQSHVMKTDYIRDVKSWYISDKVWQSLSDEAKAIFNEAAEEAGNLQTELARKQITDSLEFLKTKMTYVEPDLESIRTKLKDTFAKFDGDLWSAGLLEKVDKLKQ